jgi:hypothetical protein
MNRDEYDDFSDAPELRGGGIFQGEGLSQHNSANTKVKPDGLHIQTHCVMCGRNRDVVADWREVTWMAERAEPPEWWFDESVRLMRFRKGCSCSGTPQPYPFGLTNEECGRAVIKAMQSGYVPPQHVAAYKNEAAASRRGR